MSMNGSALKDLGDMMAILKRQGYPGEHFTMEAPEHYARVIHAELQLKGVNITYPCKGDEVEVSFAGCGTVTIVVH